MDIVGKAMKEAAIFTEPAHALFGFIESIKEYKEKQEYLDILDKIKRGEVDSKVLQVFLKKSKIKV